MSLYNRKNTTRYHEKRTKVHQYEKLWKIKIKKEIIYIK